MSLLPTHRLLVFSASQIVQVSNDFSPCFMGARQNEPYILNEKIGSKEEEVTGLSIVIDLKGKIEAIAYDDEIQNSYRYAIFEQNINAKGMSIIPGLIDAHTHPIWAGDRINEFAQKQKGASYNEITASGGGIHKTVEETKKASSKELFALLRDRLFHMMKSGVTTVECKSGYGLQYDQELRLLKILTTARNNLPLDLIITYLPAHVVPKDTNEADFTKKIIEHDIPALKADLDRANTALTQSTQSQVFLSTPPLSSPKPKKCSLIVNNIDVFCEPGYFSPDSTAQILAAGHKELLGASINFHGDELSNSESYKVVQRLRKELPKYHGFITISHLEELDINQGIQALKADGKSVAVVLPLTKYLLKIGDRSKPPARQLIDAGVPVAIGTDFNPACYCLSMAMAMHMAVVSCALTMEESLVAATLNAAASLNLSHTHGSLELHKFGDLVILDTNDYRDLIFQFGNTEHLIYSVIKKGHILFRRLSPFPDHNPSNLELWAAKQPQTGEMVYNEALTTSNVTAPVNLDAMFTNVIDLEDHLPESPNNGSPNPNLPPIPGSSSRNTKIRITDDVILPPYSDWWTD